MNFNSPLKMKKLIIISIILLTIAAIIVFSGPDLRITLKTIIGDEVAKAQRDCYIQCGYEHKREYCKEIIIKDRVYENCNDPRLKPEGCDFVCLKTNSSK